MRFEQFLKVLGRQFPERYHADLRRTYEIQREVIQSLMIHRMPCMGCRVVFRDYEIADLERYLCRGPGPDEIMVKVLFSAISVGTERAVLLGLPNATRAMPFYPGYSGCGIVTATGKKVHEIQPGDLIAGRLSHNSYTVVNPSQLISFKGDQFSPAMSLIELGCIVQQAMRKSQTQLGEHVAIVGTGLLGQMAAIYAHHLGAGRITLIGRSERRRTRTDDLPVEHDYVTAADVDATDEIKNLGADVVIEAAGTAPALIVAIEAAGREGRIVNLGSTRDYINAADFVSRLTRKSASLIGAHISTIDNMKSSPDAWTHGKERELFRRLVTEGKFEGLPHDTMQVERRENINILYEDIIRRQRKSGVMLLAWK